MAIYFNDNLCIGCYACVLACKLKQSYMMLDNNTRLIDIDVPSLIRIHKNKIVKQTDGFINLHAKVCRYCADTKCVHACPEGAIVSEPQRRRVLVDAGSCVGCGSCIAVCEFEGPIEFDDIVYICDGCVDKVIGENTPPCEAVCASGAIRSISSYGICE